MPTTTSRRCVSASSGQVLERYSYTPYGVVSYYNASWTNVGSSANANTILYSGHQLDNAISLYYCRARYYDPSLQRFVSQDPMEFNSGSDNLYAYVGENPVKNVDPRGTLTMTGTPGFWDSYMNGRRGTDLSSGVIEAIWLPYGYGAQIKAASFGTGVTTNGDSYKMSVTISIGLSWHCATGPSPTGIVAVLNPGVVNVQTQSTLNGRNGPGTGNWSFTNNNTGFQWYNYSTDVSPADGYDVQARVNLGVLAASNTVTVVVGTLFSGGKTNEYRWKQFNEFPTLFVTLP